MKRMAHLLVFALLIIAANTSAQTYKVATGSTIKVLGTSNLHDWDMTAAQFSADAQFILKGSALQDIKSLSFSVPVKNLKAKEGLMNSRAYKAMNEEKFPNITFKLNTATISDQTIKATGTLNIAGTNKEIDLQAKAQTNADGSITIKGSRKIKMSEYGIKPPSFMLGALKVGDEVTIEYTLRLQK